MIFDTPRAVALMVLAALAFLYLARARGFHGITIK